MTRLEIGKLCSIVLFCFGFGIASSAQVLTTLHSFNGADSRNGVYPNAGLIQAADGNLYGTVSDYNLGYGMVFKITLGGTLTVLHSFYGADGSLPAGLVQAADGNFYGATASGGAYDYGAIFEITAGGIFSTLYSFCAQRGCPDGEHPEDKLAQGDDGNFYGTTSGGGLSRWTTSEGFYGTVFKITPNGTLETLHSFSGSDGKFPYGGLAQGADGNFYGTTYGGGTSDNGTIFKITASGTLTTLHNFNGSDGALPHAGLIQASDGNFYGTTYGGGNNGAGTVFSMTPRGSLTTLYSFCKQGYPCSDGSAPYAGLMQATDGNFYGTTYGGGADGLGTIFEITPGGTLTTLYSFNGPDGNSPFAGLVQVRDGNFYGTALGGGAYGYGTVFRLVLPRPGIGCTATERR